MEHTPNTIQQNNTKKVVLIGLGTLVFGTLAFFGINHFTKTKTATHDHNPETNPDLDIETHPETTPKPSVHSALPTHHAIASFPIKVGAKGDVVLKLQRAIIKSYGADALKQFGADGEFGNELTTFLRKKGFSIPLSQTDYNSLTQEKKEEAVKTPTALTTFNPTAMAYGIYSAIIENDFLTAITLLKGIANTTHYASVSEQFKTYRIQGVRQTLVTAMLGAFKTVNQKIIIQNTLKNIGLTYDGDKWFV